MNKAHVGFQVRAHNPWRYWFITAIAILLLAIMFYLGRAYQSYELIQLKLQQEVHLNRIAELDQRNSSLVRKNAQLTGDGRIEHDAYDLTNKSLVTLQKEMLELKEQLVFYQGIVSPEELALGVNIQSFDLTKKNDQGLYSYKLVLTKRGKSDKYIKGGFLMEVKGYSNGVQTNLPMKQIKQNYKSSDFKFSFRYFQVFEGDMLLPDSFEPYDVELEIKPVTRKLKDFTETITWVQALPGGDN